MTVLFRVYRAVLSPAIQLVFGVQCRYEESCSRYMERSIREHGFGRGFLMGFRRLLSCNRWGHRSVHG